MARKLTLFLIAILPLGCASTPLDTNIQGHLPLRQADQTLLTTVIQGSVGALKVAPWAEQLKDKTVSLRLIGVTGAHAERLSYSLEKHLKAEAKICLLYTSPSPRDVEESRMPSSA